MKILVAALALVATNVFAVYVENPHDAFDITKNFSNQMAITIIPSKNVQATCDAESRKRGLGGFSFAVEACSFWESTKTNNQCTIVLPTKANYHTIGHEMRHCMQGNYHK